jgi:hypothetical protein
MIGTLGQIVSPPDRLLGIRDRFADGGAWANMVLALLGLAAFVGLLFVMFEVQRRIRRKEIDHPRKLFRTLMTQLGLTVRQRDLLRRMARELRLEHPTILMLGPGIYRSYAEQWTSQHARQPATVHAELDQLARALFPQSGT